MAATPVFALVAADLQAKLTPRADDRSFRIGSAASDDLSAAAAEDILAIAEDRVLSYLPEKYRSLMRYVDGEVAVRSAREGQTTFSTGLAPLASGTLRLYLNFSDKAAWSEREPDPDPTHTLASHASGTRFPLPAASYSVTESTGAVVLGVALDAGDEVRASYGHSAATGFRFLKDCAATYAAIEVSRRFSNFKSADGIERFQAWNIDVDLYLKSLAKGGAPGAAPLDHLNLVSETRGHGAKSIGRLLGGF